MSKTCPEKGTEAAKGWSAEAYCEKRLWEANKGQSGRSLKVSLKKWGFSSGRQKPWKDFKQGNGSLLKAFFSGCRVEIEVKKPVGRVLKASRHEMKVS